MPEQLADERGARPVRRRHDRVPVGDLEREARAVDLEQPPPRRRVRQRQLDGEVDPPGTRGERRLERLGAVRREHEDQVGVLVEAVHRVEQLEQQRRGLVVAAVLGDQVDVLDHDHRRLERARQAAGHPDGAERPAREQDHRALRHQAGEVHHRQRLAGPGWPVEQQPAPHVAAARAQPVAMACETGGVALDPLERALGQHDPVARHGRQRAHADRSRAERVLAPERQHLAAVDVVLAHQLAQPRQPGLGDLAARRHRLQPDARDAVVVARSEQRRERLRVRAEQQAGPT